MSSESDRRAFLRTATLAGAALATGASAVSFTGCDGKEKELEQKIKDQQTEINDLKAQLANAEPQIAMDTDGILTIRPVDSTRDIRQTLGTQWESQRNEPNFDESDPPQHRHARAGIHLKFIYDKPNPADPNGGPEDHKVNSLCNC